MGRETKEIASGDVGVLPARQGYGARLAQLRDWLRLHLFLQTEGQLGWSKVLLAVGGVIVGTVASLARTTGPGALNTTWIEDAKYLINQGLSMPFSKTIRQPISSYYQVPERILTEVALRFPLAWVPGIMSTFAAMQYAAAGLVAYIASGPHLRNRWLRLLAAAPACVIPLAYTQANNDLVTVQFLSLYGGFWTVLWLPRTRAGKIMAPIVMASVSFNAPLSLILAPLVLARLIVDRSKSAISIAALWFLGVLLQYSETLDGKSKHYLFGHNSPLWVGKYYITRVVPRALFGERALGGPGTDYRGLYAPLTIPSVAAHDALIVAAWLVVALIIVLALRRFTDPNWPLVVTAGIFSVGVFFEELLINTPVVQPRYVITPALLLYAALIAAMRPRLKPREGSSALSRPQLALRWLPVTGFAVLLVVAVGLNFRVVNGRTTSPPWTSVVATARAACIAHPSLQQYHWAHSWWYVNIPCDKLR